MMSWMQLDEKELPMASLNVPPRGRKQRRFAMIFLGTLLLSTLSFFHGYSVQMYASYMQTNRTAVEERNSSTTNSSSLSNDGIYNTDNTSTTRYISPGITMTNRTKRLIQYTTPTTKARIETSYRNVTVFPDGQWSNEGVPPFELSDEAKKLFQKYEDAGHAGATTCSWYANESRVSKECMDMLKPVTKDVRHWYFFGDSTMARPWRWCMVPRLERWGSTTIKSAKFSKLASYLGITDDERLRTLKHPNFTQGEGPVWNKLLYQYGCSTCENRMLQLPRRRQENISIDADADIELPSYAEFIGMEYARDFEFATKTMETTQETIARYIRRVRENETTLSTKNQQKSHAACVISSGMHDLNVPGMTTEIYLQNHIAMKHLLKEAGCHIWIKLELTARGYTSPDTDKNPTVFEWNQGIQKSMDKGEYQINLYDRSLNAKHGDKVHMDMDTFYPPLAEFLVDLMGVVATSPYPSPLTSATTSNHPTHNASIVETLTSKANDVDITACTWQYSHLSVSQECWDLLHPVTRGVRRWYFLGDSTMAHPFRHGIVPKLTNYSKTIRSAMRGNIVSYLGIDQSERLKELPPVNHSNGEGPTFAGLYQPGCTSCENRLLQIDINQEDDDTTGPIYAEFLTMEFARDMEFSTTNTSSTQETIARYMLRQRSKTTFPTTSHSEKNVCVISSGMHDLTIPNMTSDVYVANYLATKDLLKKAGCDIWIKLELTSKWKAKGVQDNTRIREWNTMIRQQMGDHGEFQINLYDKSLVTKHNPDNLHMDLEEFYDPLADFFVQLMVGGRGPTNGVADKE